MIKISIKDSEGGKEMTVPIPYCLGKHMMRTDGGIPADVVDKLIKELKAFSKKNPGFCLVEVKSADGDEITITL